MFRTIRILIQTTTNGRLRKHRVGEDGHH